MKKLTKLLAFPFALALFGCAATTPTQQVQVPTATVGPLAYAITDSAYDVAKDVAQQFPQWSAFHNYRDVRNPVSNIERSGVIATPDGNKVHLNYQHYRMIIAGPDRSEVTTSTLCELTVLPVQGMPGKFTITSSTVREKVGRDLFLYPPVAPIDKIAADIGSTLLKLRQSDAARDTSRLRQAAAAGNAIAQTNLGIMYVKGQGAPQDYAEAVKWFGKAANLGDADGQYNLGVMYERGLGVSRNYAEAVNLYRKAAEQGSSIAQGNLGVMYSNGNGVLQDYAQAYKWWMLSKASSNPGSEAYNNAIHNMDIYAERMAPDQIARAQKEAAAWAAKHSGGH